MSWLDYIDSFATAGALGVGAMQVRRLVIEARNRDIDRRTERALVLYRDLVVDGDTASAFHRLSVLLRQAGTERHGVTTWKVIGAGDFEPGGLFDPALIGPESPFADLYRVLWFFERAEMNIRFNLVDPDVLFDATGFHCWWWGQLLKDVDNAKAAAAVQKLAPQAVEWAKRNSVYTTWIDHCSTDFDGGAPIDLPPSVRVVQSENALDHESTSHTG